MVEKKIFENINRQEYRAAIRSAVRSDPPPAARSSSAVPIILTNEIESLAKTKEVLALLKRLNLSARVDESKSSKRVRRASVAAPARRIYKRSVLFVVARGSCSGPREPHRGRRLQGRRADGRPLAPGGTAGRTTIWSENALRKTDGVVDSLNIG